MRSGNHTAIVSSVLLVRSRVGLSDRVSWWQEPGRGGGRRRLGATRGCHPADLPDVRGAVFARPVQVPPSRVQDRVRAAREESEGGVPAWRVGLADLADRVWLTLDSESAIAKLDAQKGR